MDHLRPELVSARRSSRVVGTALIIIAFIATACAWAGLSFRDVLGIFHF
jgi:hypothetical protein